MLKSVVLLLVASVSGTPIHETLPATSKLIAAKPTVLCNLGESKKLLHFTKLFLTKILEINFYNQGHPHWQSSFITTAAINIQLLLIWPFIINCLLYKLKGDLL